MDDADLKLKLFGSDNDIPVETEEDVACLKKFRVILVISYNE